MPSGTKKGKKKVKGGEEKEKEEQEEDTEKEEDTAGEEPEIQKTSIQISTRVRDRLWRLKFRKTYDEFLWELCEMYEKSGDDD